MLGTGCGSCQCRTKNSITEQNLQNYTIYIYIYICRFVNLRTMGKFCARWPFLRLQNRRILTFLDIRYILKMELIRISVVKRAAIVLYF